MHPLPHTLCTPPHTLTFHATLGSNLAKSDILRGIATVTLSPGCSFTLANPTSCLKYRTTSRVDLEKVTITGVDPATTPELVMVMLTVTVRSRRTKPCARGPLTADIVAFGLMVNSVTGGGVCACVCVCECMCYDRVFALVKKRFKVFFSELVFQFLIFSKYEVHVYIHVCMIANERAVFCSQPIRRPNQDDHPQSGRGQVLV